MIVKFIVLFVIFSSLVSGNAYCFDTESGGSLIDFFGIKNFDKGNLCIENVDEIAKGEKEIIVSGDCIYSDRVFEKIVEFGFTDSAEDYSLVCKDFSEWIHLSRNLGVPYYQDEHNETVFLKVGDIDVSLIGESEDLRLKFLGKSSNVRINFNLLTLIIGIFLIILVTVYGSWKKKNLKPLFR